MPKNIPDKKYNVIMADPPWQYSNKNTGGSMKSGAAAKYPTMTVNEICNLQIPNDKNCVLFLWATVPLLPEGLQVMKAWGFKYKTMVTWRKIMSQGMGFWFRGQTEHLLLGVRGKVTAFRLQEKNIIEAKVEAHSQKPEVFRQLVERATDKIDFTNRLELFARKETKGWSVYGNEVENSITINNIKK